MSEHRLYRRRPGLESIEIDTEFSIFDGSDATLMLNTTASEIWRLLDEPQDAASISRALGSRFDQQPEQIEPQVAGLLQQLVDLGVADVVE
jgi:hypothetical protein